MTTKKLSRRQACWAEFLSGFNFVISYIPGRENGKADSLTRRPNDCPADDHDDRQQHLLQTILPPERLEISSIDPDKSKTTPERVIQANLVDFYCTKLRKSIRTSSSIEGINTRHFSDLFVDTKNCIRRFDRLWVPDNLQLTVIRDVHDQIATGHPGYQKTISLIARNYYWPGLKKMVRRYILNCHICRCAKAPRNRYNGLLKPLPIPSRPWTDVTLDFVTGLPISNGYNAILMVVDCLTKERHYIPCTTDENGTTTEATAQLLLQNVWKLHDLPSSLTSDRGP